MVKLGRNASPRKGRQLGEAASSSPFLHVFISWGISKLQFSVPVWDTIKFVGWKPWSSIRSWSYIEVISHWSEQKEKCRREWLKLFMIFHCCIPVLPYTRIHHLPLLYSNYSFLEADTCQCFWQWSAKHIYGALQIITENAYLVKCWSFSCWKPQ